MAGMGSQLIGAALGTASNELVSRFKRVMDNGGPCERMKHVLEKIIPMLDEFDESQQQRLPEQSCQRLEEFRQKMKEGYRRIENSPQLSVTGFSISDIAQKFKDMVDTLELEDDVKNFTQMQAWIHVISELRTLTKVVLERPTGEDWVRPRGTDAPKMQIPELPKHQVGLKESLNELKKMVFGGVVRTVGVTAMGGSGKTTLAYALCRDPQVTEHFKDIIFERVSRSQNIKGILESMWKEITKQPVPNFQSLEDAHARLQLWIREKEPQPILVVLDDVWSKDDLNDLLFEAEGYKTIVTSRYKFNCLDSIYELPLLGKEDALSLFCSWAFEKQGIPVEGHEKTLAKQIAEKCEGLPLALEVIGRSLYKKPRQIWKWVHTRLSQRESIFENEEKRLLNCMAMSIEVLKDDMKQCFLDLGLFPEKSKISVDSLLNIWVYVHNLEWGEALLILHGLEQQNLLNLVTDLGNYPGAFHGITCGLHVVQHDVLRDLAIYMAKQHSLDKCKRLIMQLHTKRGCIPNSWQNHTDAEIITIHTGSMKDMQWHKMDFPKAQALILIFAADEYFLPSFLQRMLELKVLIIINQNSTRAKIQDMSSFNSLAQLKSICLERLVVPSLEKYSQSLENLEKISLFLCKCDDEDSKQGLGLEFCSRSSRLVEITIDHCTDFKELPACVCNIPTLQKLSIRNCHDLQKLPDNLGKLGSLEVLVLHACPSLEAFPDSLCMLGELKFLDISQCVHIRRLPDKFGELCSLEELDMRECANVKNLPESVNNMKSLRQVTCDDKVEHKWLKIKDSTISELKVEKVEEEFNLDWLEY